MSNNAQQPIIRKGAVLEALPSLQFRIRMEDDGREIIGYLAGKLRLHRIRILPGDTVQVEMNSYDDSKGRIVYRGEKRITK